MRTSISFIFVAVALSSFGQDVILQGNTRRQIEKAQRISSKPVIDDTVIHQKVVEYPLLSTQYKTTTQVDEIEPATIRVKDQLDQLYTTYVKVGIGTELMPLGEVYFNNTRSRKYIYGANVKHLSSWGNIPGYERNTFDRTSLGLYGGINEKKYQLLGDIHYRNQGLHYYAIQAPKDSLGRDSTRQRYNDAGFNVTYKSNAKVDSMLINYQVGLQYNHFNTLRPKIDSLTDWRSRENFIGITGAGDFKLKEHIYSVGLDILHNKYLYGNTADSISPIDTAIVRPNTIIRLKPTFKTYLWSDKFKATVGLDFTINADQNTKVHIYPIAEVKYSLFNDIFIPYVGVRGGMKQTTLKSLTMINEFLRPNVSMLNESTAIDIYGGFKGTLAKNISFNIGGGYSFVKNLALFANDTVYSSGNRFDVIFDTAKVLTLEGSLAYQLAEKLKVDVIAKYNSYELKNNAFAWNRPNFELVTRVHYNLFDKFYANFDVKLETGRKALVYQNGQGVYEQDLQLYKKFKSIYDFNLGLEYRYTRRLSVFVQLNNIAAQRYQRWFNAPVHGFQVLGGLTFRF
ncbi:MAG TPA: hypothetical protein VKZ44_08855 [Taishania sp.]|nr:hypothetical protein [Taishania sp.]